MHNKNPKPDFPFIHSSSRAVY